MGLLSTLTQSVFPAGFLAAGAFGAVASIDGALQRLFPWVLCALIFAALYRLRFLVIAQPAAHGAQMYGFATIPQGEKWNVCMTNGELRTVSGPDVIRVWGAAMLRLSRFSATHSQYLEITYVSGRSEIQAGPTQVHLDQSVHKSIKVVDAVSLTDSDILVVYRDDAAEHVGDNKPGAAQGEGQTAVTRHIIRGPCLHVPKNSTEWTHSFSWHGSVSNDPDANGKKIKGAMKFTKLRACPEQTYFDVDGVRTKDDALLTVKVMIFYRLKDIETMLKETHDPPADFINSVSSDVIEFVAGKTFEEFKGATDQLNNLSVYQQLTTRARGIGFEVTKVVFRGYGAPARLQKMHDDAIERRTKLALDRENEEQEQQLQDVKLEREQERLRKRRAMEMETKEHERQMQRLAHEAKQLEIREKQEAQLKHLSNMQSTLSLSSEQVATYLVASEQGPPGKLVQIVGAGGGAGPSTSSSFVIQDTA
eukprot:TRINITY_DN33876_c0_g1_i4.p1 TRINITY_DN33876_c0_g1~~TRINITY_DN33876_c0_g1_i4.p1  ORF type:complete len:500 (-),score=101.05 TRINITY_DN33876_c0_g1_i4:193-1626(-)